MSVSSTNTNSTDNMPFGNTDKYNEIHLDADEKNAMNQLAARLRVYEKRSYVRDVINKMEDLIMYSKLRVFGEAFNASTRDKASEKPFPKPDQEEGEDPEDYADRVQEWCDEMFGASWPDVSFPHDFCMEPGEWDFSMFGNVWEKHAHCMICSNHKDCPHQQIAAEAERVYDTNTDPDMDEFLAHYDDLEEHWQIQKKKKRSFDEACGN